MRAKFVFENRIIGFREETDPIRDMNIGYSERVANSKTMKILEFIRNKGEEGASFTEIQFFIWTLNNKDPKAFWKKSYDGKRATRGYWATGLYGSFDTDGILTKYCKINPKTKNWVFVRFPKPGENIFTIRT